MGLLRNAGDLLRYGYDKARLGMITNQDVVTPAKFAEIASEGAWKFTPHIFPLNRKLVHAASMHARGESYRLLVVMPPQHGKSTFVSEYLTPYWLGHFPDDPCLLTAYEAEFAAKWGRQARNAFEVGAPKCFGLELNPDVAAASHWEVKGHRGSMSTAGAGGSLTGRSGALFVIDDPIKGMDEARSELFRNNMWDWFTMVVLTRLRKGSCIIMIYTPWHEDDLGQRIIQASMAGRLETWDILRIPALSESQEDRDEWAERHGLPMGMPDPIGRKGVDEPLWPEMHPFEELDMRRKTDPVAFESMYQGRPRARGGTMFKREWFKERMVKSAPVDMERCRFWDKAASQGKGDWTAGTKMGRNVEGRYYIENVVRDRLGSHPRDQKIRAVCDADRDIHGSIRIRGEQEPGSSGKDAAAAFARLLDGHDVKSAPVTGDKESRARPFASQCEAGNVYVVEGPWNDAFFDELESFPKGKWDDQVDSASGAFNELAGQFAAEWGANPFADYRGSIALAG